MNNSNDNNDNDNNNDMIFCDLPKCTVPGRAPKATCTVVFRSWCPARLRVRLACLRAVFRSWCLSQLMSLAAAVWQFTVVFRSWCLAQGYRKGEYYCRVLEKSIYDPNRPAAVYYTTLSPIIVYYMMLWHVMLYYFTIYYSMLYENKHVWARPAGRGRLLRIASPA